MVSRAFARVNQIVGVGSVILAVVLVESTGLRAQENINAAPQDLRSRIERRYEALPLRDGVLLRSKDAQPARTIQLSANRIAIDGMDVTGPELRQQLGDDADLVLELSYLNPPAQRALFGFDASSSVSPERSLPTVERSAQRRIRRSGALVRFGGDVTVGPDEVATDDVVVIGGNARVDGQVNGDVVVIGGRLDLGPRAYVTSDVTVVGGTLQRDPGAVVDGDVNQVGIGPGVFDGSRFRRRPLGGRFWPFTPFISLAGTSLRAALLMLFACGLLLFARKPIEQIGDQVVAEPVKAGAVGLLAELLFFPTLIALVVLLAVTIIGIPLLALVPFAVLAVMFVLLMGFTAVTYRLGGRIATRFGWSARNPYLSTIAGIVMVLAPLLLARLVGVASGGLGFYTVPLLAIGFLVEYVAWTIGFGAAVLARFRPAPPQMIEQQAVA